MKEATKLDEHGETLIKTAFSNVRSRFLFIQEEMDSLFDDIKTLDARLKGETPWWDE